MVHIKQKSLRNSIVLWLKNGNQCSGSIDSTFVKTSIEYFNRGDQGGVSTPNKCVI